MKKLIIITFVLMGFVGYSQVPYATMTSYVNTNLVNNSTNSITGFMINKSANDIIISLNNPYYDTGRPYKKDTSFSIQDGIPYRCIIDNSAGAFATLDWKAIGYADADSIPIENISAFTDTITADGFWVFHDEVGVNAQAVTGIPLSISGSDDVIVKITGAGDTSVYVLNTATGANTIGYYGSASGGTNSTVGIEGLAGVTVKTIPSNSYAGVYGESGSTTKHNYGVIGTAITNGIGDNVGLYSNVQNAGGAGDAWVLRLIDGNTNTNKLLRTEDAAGNMVWGIIQDDGTSTGINIAPHASRMLNLSTGLQYGIFSTTTYTAGSAYSIFSTAISSNSNSNYSAFLTTTNAGAGDAFGLYSLGTIVGSGGTAYGGYFVAQGTTQDVYGVWAETVSTNSGNNIGFAAVGSNAGTGEYYTLRLDDGSDMTGKVPISIDADGHVEMSDTIKTNTGFKFNDTGTLMFDTLIDISSADVLTSNGTPIILVAKKGATKAIMPISIAIFLDWNSVAYTTNTTMFIKHRGSTSSITRTTDLLDATADTPQLLGVGSASSSVDLVLNADLILETGTGNPAAGNSPIRVVLTYMIVDLQ